MWVPSTAGVRRRWRARVGPSRGTTGYYGPVTSLHAQAAMLMTPRAVHSLPFCSVSFRSYYFTLVLSISLVFSTALTFSFSFSFSLSLSVSQQATVYVCVCIAPPFFFLASWSKGEDGKEEVNLAARIRPTSYTFSGPFVQNVHAPRSTPPTSAIEREPGEIFERYTSTEARRLDDREAISTSRAVLSKCRKNIRARRHVRVLLETPGTIIRTSKAPGPSSRHTLLNKTWHRSNTRKERTKRTIDPNHGY